MVTFRALLWLESAGAIAVAVLVALALLLGAPAGVLALPGAPLLLGVLASASVLFGSAAAITARALAGDRRRWARPAGAALQAVILLACATALAAGGWTPVLWGAVALAGAGLALAATRR